MIASRRANVARAPTAPSLSLPSPTSLASRLPPSRSTADMSSRSQSPEDFDPTPPELLAELRGTWEVAALSQFYRAFAKAFRFPMGAKFELTEHLERALCDEEQAEALLPHLLGLERKPPDERDAEACWEEVRKLSAKETDGVPLLPEELSPLPDSLGEMAVSQRVALLLALAEAWLAQRSTRRRRCARAPSTAPAAPTCCASGSAPTATAGRTVHARPARHREAPGKPVDAARAQRGSRRRLRGRRRGRRRRSGTRCQDAQEQGRRGRAHGGDPERGGGSRGARGPRRS